MINKYRYLDILLFEVKIPFPMGAITIRSGWNQLIRKEDEYFLRSVSENDFYGSFPVKIGHKLLEKLFGNRED